MSTTSLVPLSFTLVAVEEGGDNSLVLDINSRTARITDNFTRCPVSDVRSKVFEKPYCSSSPKFYYARDTEASTDFLSVSPHQAPAGLAPSTSPSPHHFTLASPHPFAL